MDDPRSITREHINANTTNTSDATSQTTTIVIKINTKEQIYIRSDNKII